VIVCGLLEREPAKAVEHARQDHGERIEHEVFADVCGLVAAEREGGFACGHALIGRRAVRRVNRPGAEGAANDNEVLLRKDAIGLCRTRRALTIPKIDAGVSDDYEPSPSEIDEALTARKAIRALWRHGDQNRLPLEFRKSLSSFSYGSNAFILPPQLAAEALSCLVDPTDPNGRRA
jgi:hypothetical protein